MSGTEVEAQVSKPWIVYLCSDWHLYIVQSIIEFDKDGSWNSFWLIPQTGIQNSSDCREICAFILIFFPPSLPAHSSHPFFAPDEFMNLHRHKFAAVFPSRTVWRVVMREMLSAQICNLIDFACIACWQVV